MPVTLDPTVGGAAANSYASLEEATAYFDARLYSADWAGAASDDDRKRALIGATARVDEFEFIGRRASTTQRLAWPRLCVGYVDGVNVAHDVIPRAVKEAVFEEALRLLKAGSDPQDRDPLAGFSQVAVEGVLSVSVKEDAPQSEDLLTGTALRKLGPFVEWGAVRLERA